jgi:hypothetical protein
VERRGFLAALAGAAAGVRCTGGEGAMSLPFPPWHMWGSEQIVTLDPSAGGFQNTQQVAKISYRRPETWRFLLTGRLEGLAPTVATVQDVYAQFDLAVGIGRSVYDTQKSESVVTPPQFNCFAQFYWAVPPTIMPGAQNWNRKYLTCVRAPPHDDSDQTDRLLIDHFVAQDIQCRVRCILTAGEPGVQVRVAVGAYFAPNVHVRPDWSSGQFRGAETGGT